MRRISLTSWIFLAMAAGVLLGIAAPRTASQLAPAGNVFLRLVKTIIAPLLFGAIVAGLAGAGGRAMGRVGLRAVIYFFAVTSLAMLLGWFGAAVIQPGRGIDLRPAGGVASLPPAPPSGAAIIENTFPTSIIDAMARGDVLQIVVFSLMFGAACSALKEKAEPVVRFAGALAEVMFTYTNYVMYLAPLGVFAAMASTIGDKGVGVLAGLGKLVAVVYVCLTLVIVVIFGAVLVMARIPLRPFYRAVREPFLIAFSTTSSGAALPLALENMERFGVPRHIAGFVMSAGFCLNLAGSAIYVMIASLFIAQASGVDLSFSQQLLMFLTLVLTTKGIAAVPRASLVVLVGVLAQFQLPLEGLAVLLGIDPLMDIYRTGVNLLGNCLAPAAIARWEGHRFAGEEAPAA